MKKKMNGKLNLSRETLRTLAEREMDAAHGGGTTTRTETSNYTDSCDSCGTSNLTGRCTTSGTC
jgi:hypothetical protein